MPAAGKSSRSAAAPRRQQAAVAQPRAEPSTRRGADIDSILDAVRRSEELQRRQLPAARQKGTVHDSAESTAPSEGEPSAAMSTCEEELAVEVGAWESPSSSACVSSAPTCRLAKAAPEMVAEEASEGLSMEEVVDSPAGAGDVVEEVPVEPAGHEEGGAGDASEDEELEEAEQDGVPGKRSRRRQRRRRRHGRAKALAEADPSGAEYGEGWAAAAGGHPGCRLLQQAPNRSVVTLGDLGLGDLAPASSTAPPPLMTSPISAAPQPAACPLPSLVRAGWGAAPRPWPGQITEVFSTTPVGASRPRPSLELFSTTPVVTPVSNARCSFVPLQACSPARTQEPPLLGSADLRSWLVAGGLPLSGADLEAHLKAMAPDTYED